MDESNWVIFVLPACGAILLASLALALWRANRRVAALEASTNRLRSELAAAHERFRVSLAGAVHNLSQPLTGLLGTLELALRSPALPAAARPPLADALEQVQSAVSMVRLLRELAEAEMGAELAQATSLGDLLDEMREDFQNLARSRGVRLLLQGTGSARVFGSARELRRAIHYLVEHAVERSPRGGLVEITSAQEAAAACLLISHQGPSIPAEELAHWFEPFHSRNGGESAKQSALRLAIAERTCASFRGSVSAANQESGGAHFILRLPLS
jgi:two-component system sensor histidine kinase MprB